MKSTFFHNKNLLCKYSSYFIHQNHLLRFSFYPVRQDFGKTRLNAQEPVVFSVLRRVFGHGHVNTDNFVFQ